MSQQIASNPSLQTSLAWTEALKPSPAVQAILDSMTGPSSVGALAEGLKPSPAVQAILDSMTGPSSVGALAEGLKPSPAVQAILDSMSDGGVPEALRSTLLGPTEQVGFMARAVVHTSDDGAAESIAGFDEAIDDGDAESPPAVLVEWLRWLPSLSQRRLLLYALAALNEVVNLIDTEVGLEQPAHLSTIIFTLLAVAWFLSELAG
jgi:hypothetical protein